MSFFRLVDNLDARLHLMADKVRYSFGDITSAKLLQNAATWIDQASQGSRNRLVWDTWWYVRNHNHYSFTPSVMECASPLLSMVSNTDRELLAEDMLFFGQQAYKQNGLSLRDFLLRSSEIITWFPEGQKGKFVTSEKVALLAEAAQSGETDCVKAFMRAANRPKEFWGRHGISIISTDDSNHDVAIVFGQLGQGVEPRVVWGDINLPVGSFLKMYEDAHERKELTNFFGQIRKASSPVLG